MLIFFIAVIDDLAAVLRGDKTATSSLAVEYLSGDPLPLRYAELIVPVLGSGAFFVAMVIGLIGQFRARLELDESRIRSINWSGKTVVDESLANVARLQFMIQGDMMTNYVIWFASGKRIVMGAVNDRDALIELVQERTGKRFE